MTDDAALVARVNGRVADVHVLADNVVGLVVVDRIAAEDALLAHPGKLDSGEADSGLAVDDVPAKLGGDRRGIALDLDVAGEEADFGDFVAGTVVHKGERLGNVDRPPAVGHRDHGEDLVLVAVKVGGGHKDLVAGLPVDGVHHRERRRAGVDRRREHGPSVRRRDAVQLEPPTRVGGNALGTKATTDEIGCRVAAGERDGDISSEPAVGRAAEQCASGLDRDVPDRQGEHRVVDDKRRA